jgi:hypothetical protein
MKRDTGLVAIAIPSTECALNAATMRTAGAGKEGKLRL